VKRILRALGVAVVLLLVVSVLGSASALADTKTVQVDWTKQGIYPQVEPRMGSGEAGKALPDKAAVTIVCETYGESVGNGLETSNVWAQISTGGYLPNAFLNTGVNGRTPGVDECGKPLSKPTPSKAQFKSFVKNYTDEGIVVKATYWSYNGKNIMMPDTTDTVVPWENDDGSTQNLTAPLFAHWLGSKGGTVLVPWSYFETQPGFQDWLRVAKFSSYVDAKNSGEQIYKPPVTSDMKFAVGNVAIFEPMPGCYILTDSYDFVPDKTQNLPYFLLNLAEQKGWNGKRFGVVSTNC
jgi:hypothetical protein